MRPGHPGRQYHSARAIGYAGPTWRPRATFSQENAAKNPVAASLPSSLTPDPSSSINPPPGHPPKWPLAPSGSSAPGGPVASGQSAYRHNRQPVKSDQLRGGALNVFNRTQFSGYNATVNFSGLNNPAFTILFLKADGTINNLNGFATVSGVSDPRIMQSSMRFVF